MYENIYENRRTFRQSCVTPHTMGMLEGCIHERIEKESGRSTHSQRGKTSVEVDKYENSDSKEDPPKERVQVSWRGRWGPIRLGYCLFSEKIECISSLANLGEYTVTQGLLLR